MTTCDCGAEIKSAYICRVCIGRLRRDLARLAELWPETEVVLTRQTASTGGGGSSGKGNAKSTPLLFDARASETRWMVENVVTTWLRDFAGDDIPKGVHDVPTAALWLSHHVQDIATNQQGPDAIDQLRDAYWQTVRLVDRPESPVYLGMHTCGSDVWAKSHQAYQTCDCGTLLDIDEIRAGAMVKAREKWATARTITESAQMLGVRITKVMISRWYRDGKLDGNHRYADDGRVLEYRVGAVVDLASQMEERRTA